MRFNLHHLLDQQNKIFPFINWIGELKDQKTLNAYIFRGNDITALIPGVASGFKTKPG
jgi:hypothetical protein